MTNIIQIKSLGLMDYQPCMQAMQAAVKTRDKNSADEIWLLQHPPVYTQGISGTADNILDVKERDQRIPVIQSNRGGQVTYHGPGQLIAYCLLDLRRHGLAMRDLVNKIEQAVIDVLTTFAIAAESKPDAPGVYVNNAKIAALGLRVSRGYSYHGLSFNIDMDLTPFQWINPCGYQGLQVTQLRDLIANDTAKTAQASSAKMPAWQDIELMLVKQLSQQLSSDYSYQT